MKKQLNKTIISLSVATALLLPMSINAGNAITENLMGNVTKAGSWTDDRTGVTNYSGGGVVFKFKRNNNFAPWATFQAPSGGVTCNGFSFDLGFVGLMNFDGIEEQLKDASQAFMWGLLTAFKLSTPNLSAVFEYINKIIREIQQMLANACQMGQMLSKQLAKNATGKEEINLLGPIDNGLFGGAATSAKDAMENNQKSIMERYEDWVGKVELFSASKKAAALGKLNTSAMDTFFANNIFDNQLNIVFKQLKNNLNTTLAVDRIVYFKEVELKTILDNPDFEIDINGNKITWSADADFRQNYKAALLMSYNLFGLKTVSDATAVAMGAEFSPFASDNIEQIKQYHKELTGRITKDSTDTLSTKIYPASQSAKLSSASSAKGFILNGDDTKKITMKNFMTVFIAEPKRESDNPNLIEQDARGGMYFTNEGMSDNIEMDFEGLEKESRKGIAKMMNDYLNGNGCYSINNDGTLAYYSKSENASTCVSDAPFIPNKVNIYDALSIISKDIRLNSNATSHSSLLSNIANLNARILANDLIDSASEMYIDSLSSTVNETDYKEIIKHRAEVTAIKDEINKAITGINESEISATINQIRARIEHFNQNRNYGQ